MVVVLLLPVAVVFVIALIAAVAVGRSTLRVTRAGVEIRNYPQPPKLVPLERVERFEATPRVGNFASLRPATAVLVLTDGSRLPVRKPADPEAGHGVDALNRFVDSLR